MILFHLSHLNSHDPHINSQPRTRTNMAHFLLGHLSLSIPQWNTSLQSTESPQIPINTYIGIVITASPTNTVPTTHFHTGPNMFAPINSYWTKESNTSICHSTDAISLTGFSTDSKQKWTTNSANNNNTITSTLKGHK